jgi:hypothetical protein
MDRAGAVPFAVAVYLQCMGLSIAKSTHWKDLVMSASATNHLSSSDYELRFRSLFNEGRVLSFPCDASGQVNIDSLSDQARANYYFARTVIGREFAMPAVQPRHLH